MSEIVRLPRAPEVPDARTGVGNSVLLSALGACGLAVLMLALSGRFFHWFIVPVTLCGIVAGADAVDWARRRVGLLDPVGIIGLLGVHFFFLAPILNVYLDHWMRYVVPPLEWRGWLGYMAVLNLIGLLVYRWTRDRSWGLEHRSLKSAWTIHPGNFEIVFAVALVVSAGLEAYVYSLYGGNGGYIASVSQLGQAAFNGTGWLLAISESFPILAMLALAVMVRRSGRRPTWLFVGLVLGAFFVLQVLFGGLRGSRSNTIWALFWAVGITHLWLRPLPRRLLAAGAVFLVAFLYVYGFYKSAGLQGLAAIQDQQEQARIAEVSDRTLTGVVLNDLGRSDVQAYELYRLTAFPGAYDLGWGASYVSDALILVPHQLWPDRPPAKVRYGTNLLYGNGAYAPGVLEASRVYGLAGEAILNFGAAAVPVSFIFLGLLVRWVRWLQARLTENDSRVLVVPLLVCLCFVTLISDLDNDIFFLVKYLAVPLVVLRLSSTRLRVA